METDEVEMVREGCRSAEVWNVSELMSLDGTGLREAAGPGGALERLVDKGKASRRLCLPSTNGLPSLSPASSSFQSKFVIKSISNFVAGFHYLQSILYYFLWYKFT